MKSLFLVLVVCAATAFATGPFNQIIQNVENLVQATINQLISQISSAISLVKPRTDLSSIFQAIQSLVQGLGNGFIQQIANILIGTTTTILNPLAGGLKVADVNGKIIDALQDLASSLTQLLGSLAANLMNTIGKRDLGNFLGIDINSILSLLQGQLIQLIGGFLGGLNQRGIIDTVFQSLGLSQLMTMVQSVGTSLYSQFVSLATQLLFAGQNMWQQALPVFNNLVSEMTNHAGNAVQLVSQAVLQLTTVLHSGAGRSQRGLLDTVFNALGLSQLMTMVQSVGTSLYSQFVSLATQLLFAGQQMWQQAIPVFNNLVSEMTNHAGNAVQLVSQAVLQLTTVLHQGGLRSAVELTPKGLSDLLINSFGLGQVWTTIQSVGSSLVGQFTSILTQLLFAGQQMWQQAIPVFNNLVSELTNHAGNAVQLVSQAVLQLTTVLHQGSRSMVAQRDVFDWIANAFGLNTIWTQLSSVGTALFSQFTSILTQLLFAGQNMWQQAIPVFNNLVSEMTNHAGNAVQLVSQAVLQLTTVLHPQ
jgi:hypothetical protein